MRSGTVSRPLRLAIAGLLLATVASCGSSTDSNRNRNSALECDQIVDGTLPPGCDPSSNGEGQKIECEAQWDPTTKVITFCDSFAKVVVQQKDKKGKSLNEGDVAEVEGGTNAVQVTLLAGATKLEVDVWTLNPAGEARKAGDVEFEADKTATKKFMYMPDADQASATTTTPEVDRELVFGYEQHDVTQSVDTTEAGAGPFTKKTKAELKLKYRLNGAAPESNILSVTLKAYDAAGAVLSSSTKSVDATKGGSDEGDDWSELEASLRGDFMASTARIGIVISGRDGAANSGGQTGPRVTSVELRAGDRAINRNTSFDDGETDWSVVGNSFSRCSLTNGALPCITDAPFESAFTADTPGEETTTTVEETTTTVEETTTTVEETTTTVGNDEVTVQTIAPQLLISRDECTFSWTAAERTFTACAKFKAIKVAVYGTDGRYVGSASSSDSDSVSLNEDLAGAMRYAYYSLGRELTTDSGSVVVSQAREWLSVTDPTKDVTDRILLDSADNPSLRDEGMPATITLNPEQDAPNSTVDWTLWSDDSDIEGLSISDRQFVVEVNGIRHVNGVRVPVADSYAMRVYASNEFGFLDYVAGGTTNSSSTWTNLDAQFTSSDALGLLQVNADTESVGLVEPMNFVDGSPEECAGAQPILYTDPNSPSRSNRVTITLDSDCTSVNGILAVAIVRADVFDEVSDFNMSLAWWNVSSTRYSSRMTETIYLPDGKYSIFFFNPDTYFIKGIDYAVVGAGYEPCTSIALRMNTEEGLGIIEGCDALSAIDVLATPLAAGSGDSNDESEIFETDIETSGAAIELASVPDGWWQLLVVDRKQTVMGGLFAVCVRSCEIATDSGITVDGSKLSTNGTAEVNDPTCSSVTQRAGLLEDAQFAQELTVFVQDDTDHAPRAAWIDPDALNKEEQLTGDFTARFARPGMRAYLSTYCYADGDGKLESDPFSYYSRGLSYVDVSEVPTTVPANDRIENAVDITGASEVTLQQLGAGLEADEPLAGLSGVLFDRSLITTTWLKFTAPVSTRIRLTLPDLDRPGFEPVTTGITVYRKTSKSQLGFVTTNMSLAQLAWVEGINELSEIEQSMVDLTAQEFSVQEGGTYYVQVVGLSMLRHPDTLLVSSVDEEEWSLADLANMVSTTIEGEGDTTTTIGDESSTSIGSPATTASVAPATTAAPTSTDEPATTLAPTTTQRPTQTTVTTPPTQSTPSTDMTPTTDEQTSTTAGDGQTTTTVVQTTTQKVAEGMLDLIENGSRNETLPVLAGSGVPTVEAREDAISVTIGMADIIASVSKSGAEVSPQSRIIITTERGRHIAVSQKLKSITVPVAGVAATQDVKVTAYSADGKTLTSTITVEKKLAPLVKVDVAGNSPTGRIIAVVLLLVLALAVAIFARKARRSGAAA